MVLGQCAVADQDCNFPCMDLPQNNRPETYLLLGNNQRNRAIHGDSSAFPAVAGGAATRCGDGGNNTAQAAWIWLSSERLGADSAAVEGVSLMYTLGCRQGRLLGPSA